MSDDMITLRTEWGAVKCPVSESNRRGEWAAHRGPGAGWRVTHVPTGRSLATLADDLPLAIARRIVKLIDSAIPELTTRDQGGGQDVVVDPEHSAIIEAIVAEAVGE